VIGPFLRHFVVTRGPRRDSARGVHKELVDAARLPVEQGDLPVVAASRLPQQIALDEPQVQVLSVMDHAGRDGARSNLAAIRQPAVIAAEPLGIAPVGPLGVGPGGDALHPGAVARHGSHHLPGDLLFVAAPSLTHVGPRPDVEKFHVALLALGGRQGLRLVHQPLPLGHLLCGRQILPLRVDQAALLRRPQTVVQVAAGDVLAHGPQRLAGLAVQAFEILPQQPLRVRRVVDEQFTEEILVHVVGRGAERAAVSELLEQRDLRTKPRESPLRIDEAGSTPDLGHVLVVAVVEPQEERPAAPTGLVGPALKLLHPVDVVGTAARGVARCKTVKKPDVRRQLETRQAGMAGVGQGAQRGVRMRTLQSLRDLVHEAEVVIALRVVVKKSVLLLGADQRRAGVTAAVGAVVHRFERKGQRQAEPRSQVLAALLAIVVVARVLDHLLDQRRVGIAELRREGGRLVTLCEELGAISIEECLLSLQHLVLGVLRRGLSQLFLPPGLAEARIVAVEGMVAVSVLAADAMAPQVKPFQPGRAPRERAAVLRVEGGQFRIGGLQEGGPLVSVPLPHALVMANAAFPVDETGCAPDRLHLDPQGVAVRQQRARRVLVEPPHAAGVLQELVDRVERPLRVEIARPALVRPQFVGRVGDDHRIRIRRVQPDQEQLAPLALHRVLLREELFLRQAQFAGPRGVAHVDPNLRRRIELRGAFRDARQFHSGHTQDVVL